MQPARGGPLSSGGSCSSLVVGVGSTDSGDLLKIWRSRRVSPRTGGRTPPEGEHLVLLCYQEEAQAPGTGPGPGVPSRGWIRCKRSREFCSTERQRRRMDHTTTCRESVPPHTGQES